MRASRYRRSLYRQAAVVGDVQALRRGRLTRRLWNRFVYRSLGKIGRRLIK